MYLGKIVEQAPAAEIYGNAKHPYTKMLIAAIPDPDCFEPKVFDRPIGEIPSPIELPSGCSFHTRCPMATDLCRKQQPSLETKSGAKQSHKVACHYAENK